MTHPNATFPSWGVVIDMGNLHFGQRRDIVVRLQVDEAVSHRCLLAASLKYQALPINDGTAAGLPGGEDEVRT